MEEEKFSPDESLKLIQSMIDKTKDAVAGDSFYFLLWGWLVFAASVSQYILKVVLQSPHHYYVWSLMFLGAILSAIYGYRKGKGRKVKTYVEELLQYIWVSIFLTYILFGVIFAKTGWENCYTFFISLYAIGSYVSGRALNFKPLVWGAIGAWVAAFISVFVNSDTKILLTTAAIVMSYIIPGHLLSMKYNNQFKSI
jgi:hypothetical protein